MVSKPKAWPQKITPLQWRLLASYALFQVLNLLNLILAVLISACFLAFVLALRGQMISQLLPWFLLMAVPLWIGGSFWTYSLLIRYGVLRSASVKTETTSPTPAKATSETETPEPANDDDDEGFKPKVTSLRRLFSL